MDLLDLPENFCGALICKKPYDLTYVLAKNFDIRMIKLDSSMWSNKHIDSIKEFVNAGGKLTSRDMENFCGQIKNLDNVISILEMFPPDVFNSSGKVYFSFGELFTALVKLDHLEAENVVEFILDHFEDHSFNCGPFIHQANESFVNIFIRLIERKKLTPNSLLINIFSANYYAAEKKIIYSTNFILDLCSNLVLDTKNNGLAYWSSLSEFEIVHYFYSIGFDFQNGGTISYILKNCRDSRTLDFFSKLGVVMDDHIVNIVEGICSHLSSFKPNEKDHPIYINIIGCLHWHIEYNRQIADKNVSTFLDDNRQIADKNVSTLLDDNRQIADKNVSTFLDDNYTNKNKFFELLEKNIKSCKIHLDADILDKLKENGCFKH
jgi:hypothetical protein